MSIPRISPARSAASCGLCASLTPPALPRPPVFTCALTTTVPPDRGPSLSAPALASSAVVATSASSTGTPCAANRSRAWYSNRSTERPHHRGRGGTGNPSPRVRHHPHGVVGRSDGLAHVRAHPLDDLGHRGTRREDLPHAEAFELGDVGLGDDP